MEKNPQTPIQTVSSQAKEKNGRKSCIKPKRPTGLPVSLEWLQEESHGLAFIRPPVLHG
jgi:hypothetical protein